MSNSESIPINTVSEINQTNNIGNNYLYLLSGNSTQEVGRTNSATYLGTHNSKKMTRQDLFDLFKFKEDDSIFYKHLLN